MVTETLYLSHEKSFLRAPTWTAVLFGIDNAFILRLMCEKYQSVAPSPGPQTSAAGKRILIADDSELVRKITRRFLEISGFTVCGEAINGGEAVEQATQLKPDLIVLDLAMPDMNGAEAASVLKGRMPNVPIIMFSMYSDYMGQSLFSALGVRAIVSKPDGIHKLIDCVKSLLNAKPQAAAEQLQNVGNTAPTR